MVSSHVFSVELGADDLRDRHPWAQVIQAREDAQWLVPLGNLTGTVTLYFGAAPKSSFAEYVIYLASVGGRVPATAGPQYLGVVVPSGMEPLHVWVAPANEHTRRDVSSAR